MCRADTRHSLAWSQVPWVAEVFLAQFPVSGVSIVTHTGYKRDMPGTSLAPSVDRKLQCCKSFLLEFSDFHHLTANAASVKTFLIGKGDLKFWKFIFFGRENWHGQIYDMGKPYPQVIRENCLDGVCLPGKIPTMHLWEDFSTRNS